MKFQPGHVCSRDPASDGLPARFLRLAGVLLTLAFCGNAAAEQKPATEAAKAASTTPPALQHIRVTWMGNPAETALVCWTTPGAGASHVLHYDTKPRGGKSGAYAFTTKGLTARKYTMAAGDAGVPEGWAQAVLLEKLTPATTYYFVVASDEHVSREFHFITAPADERPIKLLYGADSRPARSNAVPHLVRRSMNRLIASLVESQPDIIALAHGGDYDTKGEWRYFRDWLSDHELTITKSGRILPIIPARGNHEGREGRSTFEEAFFWPGRTTPYYFSSALSGRATLVTLNSNASKSGDQRDWLEAELTHQRATPGKWVLVQYHVPAYPSVKPLENGAQQRLHWVPLFEKHAVDLVCEADDHMLKRTVPIYNDTHDPERGIIYIGDGGLGVPPRVPDLSRWYLQSPGMARPAHHVHVIELADDEMRVTAIGLKGESLDHFVVNSKAAVPVGAQ